MKRLSSIVLFFTLVLLVLILAACGNTVRSETVYELKDATAQNVPTPEVATEYVPEVAALAFIPTPRDVTLPREWNPLDNQNEPICIYTAADLIAQTEALFDADSGEIWGVHLSRPFLFACRKTRTAVANTQHSSGIFTRNDELGVYVGILPYYVFIGATATYVDNRMWGMVPWDFVEWHDNNYERIVGIMAHEVFHAWQPELFHGNPWTFQTFSPPHMDGLEKRIAIWLEIATIIHALESSGDERLTAIYDALSIRAFRRYLAEQSHNALGNIRHELLLENQEGTAIYVEVSLTHTDMASKLEDIALFNETIFKNQSLSAVGYTKGALYALLLSDMGVDWKTNFGYNSDMGVLLQEAVGVIELTPFAELDLELYGYSEISIRETILLGNREELQITVVS